jgi:hypothetical protein
VIVSIEPKPNEIVQRILSDLNINGAPKIAGHSRRATARKRSGISAIAPIADIDQ